MTASMHKDITEGITVRSCRGVYTVEWPLTGTVADLLTGVVPWEALGRLGVPEPGSELTGASLGSIAASPCSAARAMAARSSSTGSVKGFGGPSSSACAEHVM